MTLQSSEVKDSSKEEFEAWVKVAAAPAAVVQGEAPVEPPAQPADSK